MSAKVSTGLLSAQFSALYRVLNINEPPPPPPRIRVRPVTNPTISARVAALAIPPFSSLQGVPTSTKREKFFATANLIQFLLNIYFYLQETNCTVKNLQADEIDRFREAVQLLKHNPDQQPSDFYLYFQSLRHVRRLLFAINQQKESIQAAISFIFCSASKKISLEDCLRTVESNLNHINFSDFYPSRTPQDYEKIVLFVRKYFQTVPFFIERSKFDSRATNEELISNHNKCFKEGLLKQPTIILGKADIGPTVNHMGLMLSRLSEISDECNNTILKIEPSWKAGLHPITGVTTRYSTNHLDYDYARTKAQELSKAMCSQLDLNEWAFEESWQEVKLLFRLSELKIFIETGKCFYLLDICIRMQCNKLEELLLTVVESERFLIENRLTRARLVLSELDQLSATYMLPTAASNNISQRVPSVPTANPSVSPSHSQQITGTSQLPNPPSIPQNQQIQLNLEEELLKYNLRQADYTVYMGDCFFDNVAAQTAEDSASLRDRLEFISLHTDIADKAAVAASLTARSAILQPFSTTLRARVAEYIRKNINDDDRLRESLLPLCPGNKCIGGSDRAPIPYNSWEEYANVIAQERTWGEEIEMYIVSKLIDHPFAILTNYSWLRYNESSQKQTIYLINHGNMHYTSAIPQDTVQSTSATVTQVPTSNLLQSSLNRAAEAKKVPSLESLLKKAYNKLSMLNLPPNEGKDTPQIEMRRKTQHADLLRAQVWVEETRNKYRYELHEKSERQKRFENRRTKITEVSLNPPLTEAPRIIRTGSPAIPPPPPPSPSKIAKLPPPTPEVPLSPIAKEYFQIKKDDEKLIHLKDEIFTYLINGEDILKADIENKLIDDPDILIFVLDVFEQVLKDKLQEITGNSVKEKEVKKQETTLRKFSIMQKNNSLFFSALTQYRTLQNTLLRTAKKYNALIKEKNELVKQIDQELKSADQDYELKLIEFKKALEEKEKAILVCKKEQEKAKNNKGAILKLQQLARSSSTDFQKLRNIILKNNPSLVPELTALKEEVSKEYKIAKKTLCDIQSKLKTANEDIKKFKSQLEMAENTQDQPGDTLAQLKSHLNIAVDEKNQFEREIKSIELLEKELNLITSILETCLM